MGAKGTSRCTVQGSKVLAVASTSAAVASAGAGKDDSGKVRINGNTIVISRANAALAASNLDGRKAIIIGRNTRTGASKKRSLRGACLIAIISPNGNRAFAMGTKSVRIGSGSGMTSGAMLTIRTAPTGNCQLRAVATVPGSKLAITLMGGKACIVPRGRIAFGTAFGDACIPPIPACCAIALPRIRNIAAGPGTNAQAIRRNCSFDFTLALRRNCRDSRPMMGTGNVIIRPHRDSNGCVVQGVRRSARVAVRNVVGSSPANGTAVRKRAGIRTVNSALRVCLPGTRAVDICALSKLLCRRRSMSTKDARVRLDGNVCLIGVKRNACGVMVQWWGEGIFRGAFLPCGLLSGSLSLSLPFTGRFFDRCFIYVFLGIERFRTMTFSAIFAFRRRKSCRYRSSRADRSRRQSHVIMNQFAISLSKGAVLVRGSASCVQGSRRSPILCPRCRHVNYSRFIFQSSL